MAEDSSTKDTSEFFRANLLGRTSTVRRAAVKKLGMDDALVLVRVATTDDDHAIRRLAIERLEQPSLLAEVSTQQTDATLHRLACEKATALWTKQACQSGDDAREALQGLLAVACNSTLVADALRTIALKASAEIGGLAVERLVDVEALSAVAAKAKSVTVKKRAQALLQQRQASPVARVAASEQPQRTAAIDLVRQAEELAERFDHAIAAARLATLTQQWPSVDAVDKKLVARWDAATQRIMHGHAHASPAAPAAPADEPHGAKTSHHASAPVEHAAHAEADLADERPGQRLARQLRAMVGDLQMLSDEDDLIEVSRALDEANRAFSVTGEGKPQDAEAQRRSYREQSDLRAANLRAERKSPDWARRQNIPRQVALIDEAHELVRAKLVPAELRQLSARLMDLQARWKLVASVPTGQGGDLWQEFQAACEALYHRVSDERAKMDQRYVELVETREDLITKAEALATSTDWVVTTEAIRQLQAEWKATGHVPREYTEGQWDRFSAACSRFFDARKPVVEAERAAQEQAAKERESLVLQIEALVAAAPLGGSWSETTAKFRELQAEWKKVGFVPGRTAADFRQRVQTAGDALYAARNAARDAVAQAMREELAKLASDVAEALVATQGVGALTVAVRKKVVELAERNIQPDEALLAQLEQLARHALQTDLQGLRGSELDPAVTNKQRLALIASVRAMLPKPTPKLQGDESTARIAEILNQSVAKYKVGLQQDFRTPSEAADDFVAKWRALGPVVDSAGRTAQLAFDQAIADLRAVVDPRSAALDAGERMRR